MFRWVLICLLGYALRLVGLPLGICGCGDSYLVFGGLLLVTGWCLVVAGDWFWFWFWFWFTCLVLAFGFLLVWDVD